MNAIELWLELDDDLHELVIAELDELGSEGFVQEENLLKAYVPEATWGEDQKEQLSKRLGQLNTKSSWEERVIQQQDWNEPWEKSIKPIKVGDFYVRPSWSEKAHNGEESLIEIIIDPKMSFGTGHHETTRLVLRELPSFVNKGDKILDAGAGTSILSIAAIKKGADVAIGFDIDEWAVDNGNENALRNGVSDQIILRQGSFEVIEEGEFDVVFANINLNVLLDNSMFFVSKLKPKGYLLLSGVLRGDADTVREVFESAGFQIIRHSYEGEWYCVVMQKKEQ
ncbi:MAG: 50S ribosomal protein L11 methyltransferase [Rhodothermaceae bacterium]|nr:50S ribosomal protein L11 methyltransferase [Rhodothermaceae bacterium]